MMNGKGHTFRTWIPTQERDNGRRRVPATRSLSLLAPVLCWLFISGCPASWGPFGLSRYLPLAKGNSWTFGCVALNAANASESIYYEARVEDISFANYRRNWLVTVSASDESDWTSSPAGYYFLEDGILYNTASIPSREALFDPASSGFIPFLHQDLTPRTIADPNDPLRRFYQTDIRYVAGTLEEFLPLRSFRYLDDLETEEYYITQADFGAEFRSMPDCIALEAYRSIGSEEPQWNPVLILGRGVGPLVIDIGPFSSGVEDGNNGFYVTLDSASTRCRR